METIKELNMEELDQISGGSAFCVVLGFSTGEDLGGCLVPGAGTDDTKAGIGFNLCKYVGFGAGPTFSIKNDKKN